jgi:hypothetical protein
MSIQETMVAWSTAGMLGWWLLWAQARQGGYQVWFTTDEVIASMLSAALLGPFFLGMVLVRMVADAIVRIVLAVFKMRHSRRAR